MNQHYEDERNIDPSKSATLGDGSPNDNDRIEIGRHSWRSPNGTLRACNCPTLNVCANTETLDSAYR